MDRENCFHWKLDEQPGHLFSKKRKIGVKPTSIAAFLSHRDRAKYCDSLMWPTFWQETETFQQSATVRRCGSNSVLVSLNDELC